MLNNQIKLLTSLWIIVALMAPTAASAFGPNGHRTVGKVAEGQLTPKAYAAVQDILQGETIASASIWPDQQRSAPLPSPEFWKNAANWHFVNVDPGKTYTKKHYTDGAMPRGCPRKPKKITDFANFNANAYEAIVCFSNILRKGNDSQEVNELALKFVIHLAGDIHQPMHAGHAGDFGGNSIKLRYQFKNTNLHSLWDSVVLEAELLSFSDRAHFLTSTITNAQRQGWYETDPYIWLMENFELAEDSPVSDPLTLRELYYQLPDHFCPEGDDGLPNCRYQFAYFAEPMINGRMAKGGIRLADLLNDIFDPVE